MALQDPGLVQILASDPGADLIAQEAARRKQAMTQMLMQQQQAANDAAEFKPIASGGGGETDTGFKQGDYLGSLFNGENPAAPNNGPVYAPGYNGGNGGVSPNPFNPKYAFGGETKARGIGLDAVAQAALRQGASPKEAAMIAAISQPESAGNPHAHNGRRPDDSYGLLQINMLDRMGPERRARYGLSSNEDLYDPDTNIRVGLDLARRRGNYKDWSTYLNGAYQRYLPAAEQAVQRALGKGADAGAPARGPQYASIAPVSDASPAAAANPGGPLPIMARDPAALSMPARVPAPQTAPQAAPQPNNGSPAPMPPRRPAELNQPAQPRASLPPRQLSAPQPEDDDPFSAIGHFIEGLFGGGDQPAQAGTQVAANSNGALGWGQGGYVEHGKNGHGLIGRILDMVGSGEQVPPPVINTLLHSDKESERYLAMMADPTQTPQSRQVYEFLARNAYEKEKLQERQFTDPHMNDAGQLVQEGANGQVHVISTPKQESKPAKVQELEYLNAERAKAGQPPMTFEEFNKTGRDGANHRHVIGGALVDDDGKVIYSKPEESLLTPEATDDAAHALNLGDDSHLKNLGRGAQGGKAIAAIRNRAAEFRRQTGDSVSEIMQKQAEYGGVKARERTIGTQEGNAVVAAQGAANALKIARGSVDALGNGEFTDVNGAINAYKNHTGKPEVQAWGQAAATLANTYARAVNPKGLPHESVLRDAIERLSGARSPEQLHAIMDIMEREIEMEVNAPRQARQSIKDMDNGVEFKVNSRGAPAQGGNKQRIIYDANGNEVQ